MSDYIYKPSAVKHFRRFAEEMRAESKKIREEIKKLRIEAKGLPRDQYRSEITVMQARADLLEKYGKELKELSSAVLHDEMGIL